jgi:hypothetical protein
MTRWLKPTGVYLPLPDVEEDIWVGFWAELEIEVANTAVGYDDFTAELVMEYDWALVFWLTFICAVDILMIVFNKLVAAVGIFIGVASEFEELARAIVLQPTEHEHGVIMWKWVLLNNIQFNR